jgi:hypothetical protein
MKYKIIKSDLLINGKLIPENSEVELSAEQIKGIENYLEPIQDKQEEKEIKSKRGNK